MTDSGHIFISYARKDGGEHAGRLHTALESAGFRAWRDTRDIDPAQDFSAEIESGIEKAACVALCLTPESKRADSFVRREIQYAQVLKKPVIPLRFAEIAPHVSVITNEWIDFYKGWDAAFDRLCTVLKRPVFDAAPLPPASSADDPFRDYLNALYQNIVRYLNLTVFSLVTLRGESAPDAVERAQVLPMAFFAMAGVESPDADRKQFQNFHEAFAEYNGRVLLLGDPGAGKTTTLFAFARDRVAARLEDSTLPLPILVPISTWDAQKQTPLLEWLAAAVPALKRDNIAHLLDSKRALLLLDGLDELGNEREDPQTHEFYDPRLRFIEHIIERQPAAPILISCRIKDYADIGHKVSLSGAVTLQPLDDNQMRAYLNDLPDLWAALEADNDLREVARTPLLLSLFTFAFRDLPAEAQKLRDLKQGDLRDKIFETYVHRRYEREVRKPNVNLNFSVSEIYEILGRVGMYIASRSLQNFDLLLTEEFFADMIGNQEKTNDFLGTVMQLNILVRHETKSSIRFVHLLLRDHFTFLYTMRNLFHENNNVRWHAVHVLGKLKDTRAIDGMIRLLEDIDPFIRISAASALSNFRDERVIDHLLIILSDENVEVRSMAADSLSKLGPIVLDKLVHLLRNHDNFRVRYRAASILGNLEVKEALDPLIEALEQANSYVRAHAARALGKLGDKGAVCAIEKLLNDSDELVRNDAVLALTRIGTPEALEAVRQWREKENNPPQDSTQSQPDSN